MDDAAKAEFYKTLRAPVGTTGTPNRARDAVNQPMIRHWCDAMQDANPNYTDPAAAAAGPHGEIVAPPMMLNAWTMLGNIPRPLDPSDPQGVVGHQLDSAGYVGVVATNCEHVYTRYPRLGDHLTGTIKLVDVSEEKQTGLGIGHFVTTETEYQNQDGEHVGSMFFRILKFKPGTGRAPSGPTSAGDRPRRPRPGMNQDTRFFWDGLRAGELRIQRCNQCGALEHPPTVRCLTCGSTDRGYLVASGRAHLYSFVVAHHPQVPSFDYPLNIGLVELEEGIRLVTNIVACSAEQLEVGMPLELCFTDSHDDITLHQFRPARPEPRTTTLRFDDVNVGDKLPLCPIPITPTLIVSTAIASRDYQDVHHDRDQATRKGSKDIFMNILTSSGLSGRFVTDWAGPDAILKNLKIRLGAPNYPYDTMTMSGSVAKKEVVDGQGVVQVAFEGRNSLGAHVTGTIDLRASEGRVAIMMNYSGTTAIVGIGATEFSKDSGRTPLALAVEACQAALEDAGVDAEQVNGIVTFSAEMNTEIEVARNLGIPNLTHFSMIHHGGGAACGTIAQAAMAVASGQADYVLVYRAFNERSWARFGAGVQDRPAGAEVSEVSFSWSSPFGLLTPASWVAMFATRYMHEYGATSEDFGRVAVADRRHAATNPKAHFYQRPITLEDHQNSRWIMYPLHLLDCCQESDGGQALLVTTMERARDLRQKPAKIAAAAQGSATGQQMMRSYYRPSITGIPEMALCAQQLYENSGIGPADIQTAVFYDHFTPLVLPQLEEFGFCGRGEAKDFIRDGALEIGGRLPINTNGGQLGEAYIHGMNGIAEAVRQVRGSAVNQIDGVENVLVTAGTAVPTSALIVSQP